MRNGGCSLQVMMEQMLYREKDGVLYLKAVGHITAAICPALKRLVSDRLSLIKEIAGVAVDLSECTYMDSTFLGLLVGFNKEVLRRIGARLSVYGVSDECRELLRNLGIDRLVDMPHEQLVFPPDMEEVRSADRMSASLLLKAHEDLMDICERNKKQFAALHAILRKQAGDPAD